jgi:DNA adenine methylase
LSNESYGKKTLESLSEPSSFNAIPPLLKWPGGKRALLPQLLPHFPNRPTQYFEPFLGGAAVFLSLWPARAVLSDTNSELVNLYVQVKDYPNELIRLLRSYKNNERYYYAIRESKPRSRLKRAARLIYLMRLSFNGIHRVNFAGEFNVPYGHRNHLSPCDEESLIRVSRALQSATIREQDFEAATRFAKRGAVVYFDPPYTVAHENNGFIRYNERIFSWDDQLRLAAHARRLANRGCHVVVSNADHASVRKLYKDFRMVRVRRSSTVAALKEHRRVISELIFIAEGGRNVN